MVASTVACSKTSVEAMEHFRRLIPREMVDQLQPSNPLMVYSPFVTVWLLIYQRLNNNATLQTAVTEFLRFADQMTSNKRVREGTLSTNTGTYSQARSRLRVDVVDAIADRIFDSLLECEPPALAGRRTFVIDGTTLPLSSNPKLRERWPAASNQHGEGAWPCCHLVVAHDLETGMALRPQVGAKFGPSAVSEQALAIEMLPRIPAKSLLLADRNFGVFSFFHAGVTAGHDVLTRLTQKRFRSMQRSAELVKPGLWRLHWKPTRHDRLTNPNLPADAVVTVYLHEIAGFNGESLWCATTCDMKVQDVQTIYARRWEIETDICHLKHTLEAEALRGQSPDMILKELAILVISYNLVVQVRRLAAARVKVSPKRISFTAVWNLVRIILLAPNDWTEETWQAWFERVVNEAGRHKLPNRPGRSYPREVIPKRRTFPERKRKPVK